MVGTQFCSDCGKAYEFEGQARFCAYLDDMQKPDYAERRAKWNADCDKIEAFMRALVKDFERRATS
jgi:hypothetical protein